jgi:hypothetical protein
MKKIYTTLAIIAAVVSANAQTPFQVTFEDQNLTSNSGRNDAGATDLFTSGTVRFDNFYDTTSFFWSGFAMSNVVNTTIQSYTNDLASSSGNGHNSASYAVFYKGYGAPEKLRFAGNSSTLDSMFINNTTYAYLEMLNGGYGKVFGSVNATNGSPDGTNGNDFFILEIFGHDATGTITDSMDVFLADYRLPAAQDYITNTWKKVIFTGFDNISYLTFSFTSSDNDPVFGIKTPTYFAVDDIYGKSATASLSADEIARFTVFPNPTSSTITISKGNGKIAITDLNGAEIKTQNHSLSSLIDVSSLSSGIYFVSLTENNGTTSRMKFLKN